MYLYNPSIRHLSGAGLPQNILRMWKFYLSVPPEVPLQWPVHLLLLPAGSWSTFPFRS